MWLRRADGFSGFGGAAIISADGTNTLFEGEWEANAAVPQFLWSPDGSQLAYTVPEDWPPGQNHVYVVAADGSDGHRLTSEPDYYFPAGWAADGRLLVTTGGSAFLLMGDEAQELPLPEGMPNRDVQLSPDGRKVAIQQIDYDKNVQELWLLEIETLELRLLSHTEGEVRRPGRSLYVSAGIRWLKPETDAGDLLLKGPPPVTWSPDSIHIAYHKTYTDVGNVFRSGLWVMDAGSGEEMLATNESNWWEAWSPDGRYLAFSQEGGELALFGPGGQVRELGVTARQATWSGSGRLVAATPGKVTLIDPESGAMRIVTLVDGEDVSGSGTADGVWSPTGRYLAFTTPGDGDRYYSRATYATYVLDAEAATVTLILEKGNFHPVGWLSRDADS